MSGNVSKPSIKYLRGYQQPATSGYQQPATFAMMPAEVLFDKRLTNRDKNMYNVMAYYRDGAYLSVGERRLSGAAGINRREFAGIRDRLVECGHIKVDQRKGRERASYRLTAPLFTGKSAVVNDAKVVDTNESSDQIGQLKAPPKICPECHKKRRGLMALGWCRSCNSTKKMKGIARQVVREEIGETA